MKIEMSNPSFEKNKKNTGHFPSVDVTKAMQLTLNAPITFAADNILIFFFLLFLEEKSLYFM